LNQKYYENKDLDPRTRLGKVVMLELLRKTEYLDNTDNKLTIFFTCYRSLFEKIDLGFLEENKIIGTHEVFDYIYEVISAKKHGNSHLVVELLFLLGLYLSKRKPYISVYVKKYELIQLLTRNFVFSGEKNRNQSGFEQVMKVLLIICQNSFENLEEFIGILNEKMKEGLWRSDKKNSWEFHPNFKEKSVTGYVGLKNLGCS